MALGSDYPAGWPGADEWLGVSGAWVPRLAISHGVEHSVVSSTLEGLASYGKTRVNTGDKLILTAGKSRHAWTELPSSLLLLGHGPAR